MIAAYTFSSAEDLTGFCARHCIGREDTYSVLQSLVAPIWEGECHAELRLSIVLDMNPTDLERIKERERAHLSIIAVEPSWDEPPDTTQQAVRSCIDEGGIGMLDRRA